MKQETIEEAAEKYLQECRLLTNIHLSNPVHAERCKNNFIAGSKHMAERMYSEEDLKEAFKVNYTPFSATNIGDFDKDWNKWFKQFKKK